MTVGRAFVVILSATIGFAAAGAIKLAVAVAGRRRAAP